VLLPPSNPPFMMLTPSHAPSLSRISIASNDACRCAMVARDGFGIMSYHPIPPKSERVAKFEKETD